MSDEPDRQHAEGSLLCSGSVALITGASSGIGAAIARRLAARGQALVLGARRLDRVDALAAALTAEHGVRCRALALDVRGVGSVDAFVAAALDFSGAQGPHLLVNNAGLALGVARLPTATLADEADWQTMLETNVLGLLRVTRRLLPALVARGAGHVINIGSVAALEPYEGGSVYCASKAAVRSITRAMRYELLGSGVRACCVHPGMVDTEFSQVRLRDTQRAEAVYRGMTPLTADDVARAVVWVADQPPSSNVEELWLHPSDQASAQRVHRREA